MNACMKGDTQTRLALHGCIIVLIGLCAGIGFYIPGCLPLPAFAIFVWAFYKAKGVRPL